MKHIKYLLVFVFAATLSLSCNNDDDNSSNPNDSALVGTWGATESEEGMEFSVRVTFNANGIGTLVSEATFEGETFTDTDSFTWSTNGNKLTINISGEASETGTYAISGNRLTITDTDGEVTVLTKQ